MTGNEFENELGHAMAEIMAAKAGLLRVYETCAGMGIMDDHTKLDWVMSLALAKSRLAVAELGIDKAMSAPFLKKTKEPMHA